MTAEPFLKPRLIGERFDDHAVPLGFLKDLAVLEEFVIEVAKAEFLKEYPDRQRSPRGFTDGVTLKLATVEDGSAVPVIVLSIAASAASLIPSDAQVYLERGRDAIVRAINAASQNQPVADILPEKTLGYFDRLGRSLRANEAVEFTTATITTPARLTRETRRRLVLASSAVKEITDETTVRGTIPEADQDDMTFELQLSVGHKVKAPLTAEHLEPVVNAFAAYQTGQKVSIKGIGRFNRSSRLLSLDSVEHVTLLEALDVPARLDELRLLKSGWLEGQGVAPSQHGMDWLADAFATNYPDELPLPYTYPTPEGNIRFEWPIHPYEASLDIDLATHQAVWHQLNLETDADEELLIALDAADGWRGLADRIRQIAGGA